MKAVRIGILRLILPALLVVCVPGISTVDAKGYPFEIGIEGGFVQVDEALAGADGPEWEPTLGARIGGPLFTRHLGWYGDALYMESQTETFRGDARSITARAGLEYLFSPERPNSFYAGAAAGLMSISFDNATDFDSGIASASFGQWVWLSGSKYLRWELRVDHALATDGLSGEDLTQPQFLIGLHWRLGRRPRDTDGDGVVDGRDRCADTSADTAVDRYGCSLVPSPVAEPAAAVVVAPPPAADADADGVPDERDLCAGTIRGVEVDAAGCALDADGDGVHDGLGMDKCLGTPAGAVVDAHGCPLDGDGDTVPDGLDRCPDTPPGVPVDETGCPPA